MFNFLESKPTLYFIHKTITFLTKVLKKNEILFIILSNNNKKLENKIFIESLLLKNYKVINNWSNGLITNFYQFCKNLNNKDSYSILSSTDFTCLNYIFLNELPEKNSSLFKELLLLKQNLNIKIISLVDINNKNFDLNLVDIPLYFDSSKNVSNVLDKKSIIFYILSKLK
jgi:hypothetical protein